MRYLLFLKSSKILKCHLLQIVGGASWVNLNHNDSLKSLRDELTSLRKACQTGTTLGRGLLMVCMKNMADVDSKMLTM